MPEACEKLVLNGTPVVRGQASGLALVAHDPVSFLGMVNTETGAFDYPGHELQGQSIKGRVLVYPFGKGSSGDTIRIWRMQKYGVAPAAILFNEAEPIHAQGAILINVPCLYGFDRDICATIATGDQVEIDGARVTVSKGPVY
jgi:uncharacterized protein